MRRQSPIKDLFEINKSAQGVAKLVKEVSNSLSKIDRIHGLPVDGESLKVAQYWRAFKDGHAVPEYYRKQFAAKIVEIRRDERRIQDVITGKINPANAEEQRLLQNQDKSKKCSSHHQDTII